MRILGVDPGLNGALAIYDPDEKVRWDVIDVPTSGDDSQRRINAPVLAQWITACRPEIAYVESVAAFPGQGVSSMFRFGRATGAIEATIACCGVPITLIVPQTWKKFHGLRGSDKEQSRALAIRKFPSEASLLARRMDQNRAEALLIAYFGAAATGAIRSMSPLGA